MKKHPLQDVEREEYFKLHMGNEVKSLEELRDALKTMSKSTFNYHIKEGKNDFADWVKDIIKDDRLAEDLKYMRTKEKILQRTEDRIDWLHEELKSTIPYHLHMHSHINQFLAGALLGLLVGLVVAKMFSVI
ncbi:hypothetical protein HQ529_06090 [Candidatus Woesearchaeota archaeon]|nr:hypothetical protein [Candidatus Woesearchaeota archaeon]